MKLSLLYISRTMLLLGSIVVASSSMSQTRMDKYETDKLIFNMLTQTEITQPETLTLPLEICPDSLEETSEKNIYMVRGKTYKFRAISQNFYVRKTKKNYIPLYGQQWPVETLQNLLTGHLPATLRLNLSHHQYGGKIQTAEVPLAAFFQIFSASMDFFACINEANKDNIHAFLIMHHPGMNYIHMLRIDLSSDSFEKKISTAKADLYTNIPQDNIKKLFDE